MTVKKNCLPARLPELTLVSAREPTLGSARERRPGILSWRATKGHEKMKRVIAASIVLVSGVVLFSGFSYAQEKGLSFYATFDKTLEARVAGGTEPFHLTVDEEARFEKGVKGEALILNGMDSLTCKTKKGYFSFKKGTISIWIKMNFNGKSFSEKIGEELKKQTFIEEFAYDEEERVGGYTLFYELISILGNKMGFWISHKHQEDRSAAVVMTYPSILHIKRAGFPFEKDKWVNLLYTWDTEEENLEFYVNGERTEGRIRGTDIWDIPEDIDYDACRITINSTYIGGGGRMTTDQRKELLKKLIPDNFTYTIDEARIYDRALSEKEIKGLYAASLTEPAP